jgi:putative ABC transport system permease protein
MNRSLRSWLWRVPLDQEVDEEIAFHVEMRMRELVEKGVDPRIAREMVLARLGDVGRLKRACVDLGRKRDRAMRLTRWCGEFREDVRFALRQLKAAPGFTLVAVLTLALGIGANSAMFALADASLVRPLPYPEPDRLVSLSELRDGQPGMAVNPVDFVDWEQRTRSFTAIAAVVRGGGTIVGDDGVAEPIPAQAVTTRFFDVLGVRPIAGRTFREEDEGPAPDVVVLSEGLWRRRFGGDSAVVGRATRFGDRTFTVIGIVPADFQIDLPGTTSAGPSLMWTLLNRPRGGAAERYPHYLQVIGRLKQGVSVEAARGDVAAVADALAQELPATNKGHTGTVVPLRDRVFRPELRLTAILLFGVVGLVLLMCCANVANLLLARASARSREFAIRSALGAGRRRIIRQVLSESLVLAVFGGLLGGALGAAILKVAPSLIPSGLIPASVTLGFDARVVMFCALAALVVAILYGLSPAWQVTHIPAVQAMVSDGRSVTGASSRFRRTLAVAQVAIAVFLLCGAGLLLRTLLALEAVDSGSRAGDLLTMIVAGGGPGPSGDPESMRRKYEAFEREVRQVPGVRDVAWGSGLPFGGLWYVQSFEIEGDPPRLAADRENAGYQIVSPSYLPLLGVPLFQGRGVSETDIAGSPQVCVVDQEFVRRFLSGRAALGTRIAINAMVTPPRPIVREIVGVVGQVKERPDEREPQPHVYVPIAQEPWWNATLVIEPAGGPADTLTPGVRAALARVDRNRPPVSIRTLSAIVDEATARPRFRAVLIGAFALLALVLAMVGLFGVLAYSVQQRTREFGVRIALGADATKVLVLVLGNAARMIGLGVVIGLTLALAFAQSVAAFLFGVEPRDPMTFGAVSLVLVLTAMVACAVPALRAVRVDPVEAFRNE